MNKARFFAETLGHGAEKGGHIVVGLLENFRHALEVALGQFYLGNGFPGNNTELGPGIADGYLYFKPLIVLVLVRPYLFHFGSGIPFNHYSLLCLPVALRKTISVIRSGIYRRPP